MAQQQRRQIKQAKTDLPYNSGAEQAVLGSALLSKDAMYQVLSSLNESEVSSVRSYLDKIASQNSITTETLLSSSQYMSLIKGGVTS